MKIVAAELNYGSEVNEYAHLFTFPGTNNKWYYNQSRLGRTHVIFRLTYVRNAFKNTHAGNNVKICEYLISSMCQNNKDMIQLRNLSGNEEFEVIAKINDDYSIDVYARANWHTSIAATNRTLVCEIIGGDMGESCIFPHAYSKPVVIEDVTGYLQCYLQNVPVYADITTQNGFTWATGSRTGGKVLVNQADGTCEISAKVSGSYRGNSVNEAVRLGIIADYVPSVSETTVAYVVLKNKTLVPLQCVVGTTGNIIVYGLTSELETDEVEIDFILLNIKYRYKLM